MLQRSSVACSAGVALIAAASALTVKAQDRMPPIPPEKMTAEQKKAVEESTSLLTLHSVGRGPGGVGGPFGVMLRSPEVMNRNRAVADYVRTKTSLPPRLSEFVILITARDWTSNFEWRAHYDAAMKAGLSRETASAVAQGRRPAAMADDEQIIYDFCIELLRNRSVSDDTYARALSKFGEKGIVDTVAIVGYYVATAMFLNTARTPLPGGASPPLATFPH